MDFFVRAAATGHKFLNKEEYAFWPLWGNLSFPHRPTVKEVEIYRKFIGPGGGRDRRFLILGPTPELRDLAAEFGGQVFVFDISHEMISRMLKFANRAKAVDEIWVKGNWLDDILAAKYFDAALGDLSLRHIAPELQNKFLANVARVCRNSGKCILRVHTANPRYKEKPYLEIFEEIGRYPYAEQKYEAMGILLSRLLDRSTKNQRANPEDIANALREYFSSAGSPFSYRLFLHEFFAKRINSLRPLSSQTKDETEFKLLKHFTIRAALASGDYPESEFYPIYELRPRL